MKMTIYPLCTVALLLMVSPVAVHGQNCTSTTNCSIAYLEVDWSNCPGGAETLIDLDGKSTQVQNGKFYTFTLDRSMQAASFNSTPNHDLFEFVPQKALKPKPLAQGNRCVIYQKFIAFPVLSLKVEASPSTLKIPFTWDQNQTKTTCVIDRISTVKEVAFVFQIGDKQTMTDKPSLTELAKKTVITRTKSDCIDIIMNSLQREIQAHWKKKYRSNLEGIIKADAIIYSVQ
jgi:hypothetical protein